MGYVKQFVKTQSMLEEKIIQLENMQAGEHVISALIQNASLISIDLHVLEAGAGNCDLGIQGDTNIFLGNIDLAQVKNNQSSVRLPSVDKTLPIVLDLKAPQTAGKILIRIHFFTNTHRYLETNW